MKTNVPLNSTVLEQLQQTIFQMGVKLSILIQTEFALILATITLLIKILLDNKKKCYMNLVLKVNVSNQMSKLLTLDIFTVETEMLDVTNLNVILM